MAGAAGSGGKGAGLVLSFDCDLDADEEALPALLERLRARSLPAAFACIGSRMRSRPALYRGITQAGHQVLNHTETHPWVHALGPGAFREEVRAAHETCIAVTGQAPAGFRMPHFGASGVYSLVERGAFYLDLAALGYRVSSSTLAGRCRGGMRPFRTASGVWEFPLSPCPRHPFGTLDSHHAVQTPASLHRRPGEFEGLLSELLEEGMRRGAFMNLYFDPSDVAGRDGFWQALDGALGRGLRCLRYGEAMP